VARNYGLDLIRNTYNPSDYDWFLWVDADEVIQNAHMLRSLVSCAPYDGMAIRQWHLQIDTPNYHDKPIRMFRLNSGARFYGVVHEQPETVIDQGIMPALLVDGVDITQTGYVDGELRRHKMLNRNLPLLRKELAGEGTHPTRMLARVLAMRDYLNLAREHVEQHNLPEMDDHAIRLVNQTVKYYHKYAFDDPASKYHEVAWPFYQAALSLLSKHGVRVIQVGWGFTAVEGELKGSPKPEKFMTQSAEEISRIIQFRTDRWLDTLRMPSLRLHPVVDPSTWQGEYNTAAEPAEAR
jgi:hypothetical protein